MIKLTTRLLTKAVRHTAAHSQIQHQLSLAFKDRYGVTYSDIDCDQLIDLLDYNGHDKLTLEEADKFMTELGHPPLNPTPQESIANLLSSMD